MYVFTFQPVTDALASPTSRRPSVQDRGDGTLISALERSFLAVDHALASRSSRTRGRIHESLGALATVRARLISRPTTSAPHHRSVDPVPRPPSGRARRRSSRDSTSRSRLILLPGSSDHAGAAARQARGGNLTVSYVDHALEPSWRRSSRSATTEHRAGEGSRERTAAGRTIDRRGLDCEAEAQDARRGPGRSRK